MPIADRSMTGKICLVTGATSGLGEVTARALAQRGATVIGVGRNPEKCAATVKQIKQQTGNPASMLLFCVLDSGFQSATIGSSGRGDRYGLFPDRFDKTIMVYTLAVFTRRVFVAEGRARRGLVDHNRAVGDKGLRKGL